MPETKQSVGQVLTALHEKLGANLSNALCAEVENLAKIEVAARRISDIPGVLRGVLPLTRTQDELLCVFDEVFADVVCSVYLAAAALDVPARMSLRRGLELGVATVYLWDLPHAYWSWKKNDSDLNFKDMVAHLNGSQYSSFLSEDCADYDGSPLLDEKSANSIYRRLSNVIQGKISGFETTTSDRFEFAPADWSSHLRLVDQIESLLFSMWEKRFSSLRGKY